MSRTMQCAYVTPDRYQRILKDDEFRTELAKITKLEETRIYCGHDMTHLLDVARIAYIRALEVLTTTQSSQDSFDSDLANVPQQNSSGIQLSADDLAQLKDKIYAAALLHDIGRGREYEEGISHDIASVEIAKRVLVRCGFMASEIEEITQAIEGHRGRDYVSEEGESELDLAHLIKEADHKSRLCFACQAEPTCKWASSKKNMTVER